mmetsp:Transcript_30342/g.69952  ORF Transcript_30342/g.69952 Transcript_30342/m.69952 type:complete len:100 (+) Transcript_30342:212-511(+)
MGRCPRSAREAAALVKQGGLIVSPALVAEGLEPREPPAQASVWCVRVESAEVPQLLVLLAAATLAALWLMRRFVACCPQRPRPGKEPLLEVGDAAEIRL